MRWTAAAFNSSNAIPQAVADSFRGARFAGEKLQGGRGERVSTGKKPERAGAGAGPRRALGCTGPAPIPVLLPCEVLPAFSPLFPSLPGEPPQRACALFGGRARPHRRRGGRHSRSTGSEHPAACVVKQTAPAGGMLRIHGKSPEGGFCIENRGLFGPRFFCKILIK